MSAVTLRFWKERSTRNKVVFAEEHVRGQAQVVGQLYVAKERLEAWGNPEVLRLTIGPDVEAGVEKLAADLL